MRLKKRMDSISARIILIIIALILPMNIYMLYSARRSQEIIIEHTKTSMENVANLYMSDLESRIKTINNFVMELEEKNSDLDKLAKSTQWDDYFVAGMGLRSVLNDHIAIYHDAEVYFYYSENIQHGMLVENAQELTKSRLEEALFSEEKLLQNRKWQIQTIDETKWLLHVNYWKGLYVGAGIQLDTLEATILENIEYDTVNVYIDGSEEAEISGRGIAVTRRCAKRNIYLHIQVEESEVIRNLPVLQRSGLRIALIELLIIPIMILAIRMLVIKPLKTINIALNRLKTDPAFRIEEKASTEDFSNVFWTFNNMADEIVMLKIDNYEHKLERQKVELRNLQLQVKPHFLFNSLNLMYNLVQMKQYKSIQTMLLYFSDYFRYINVGDHDFTSFAEELKLIRKYLEVAMIRYPDILEVEYQIDDSAKQVMIPQLLIHNFVENVVKHGLALKRKNQLILKVYIEQEMAVFHIRDNGVGMPKEQADNINNGVFKYADGKEHLGLENSYRRVRFFYGEKSSMRIVSEKGCGTTVILKIPVNPVRVTEGAYELTDCE